MNKNQLTLTERWQGEKDKLAGAQHIKEQLDAARIELEQAQRKGDLARRLASLSYSTIPELGKEPLQETEEKGDDQRR